MTITLDQALAIAGIIISVAFGVFGYNKLVSRRTTQDQKVGPGGHGIQVGRDIRSNDR
jgi:hypothetical protein